MKKIILTCCFLVVLSSYAQDHFGGINTSRRVSLLSVGTNPSELINIKNKYEINFVGTSVGVSNNKISFGDIIGGEDLESKIFEGSENVNFSINGQIALPGVAFKVKDWAFAVTTNIFIQGALTDFDANFGRNVTIENSLLNNSATFGTNANQRFNATTYGEIGFAVAKTVFQKGDHTINAGLNLKLMSPGSYGNFGAERLSGRLTSYGTPEVYLSDVNNATLNIAYSEASAGSYDDAATYTSRLIGGINGFATDFGFNYIWKKSDNFYKLKAGFSVRNIGSMTYKGKNNQSTNYSLTIAPGTILNRGLNMDTFSDVNSLAELEQTLLNTPGINFVKSSQQRDFKVSLPTVVNLYADYNVTSKLNVTMFMQQKTGSNNDNDQIASENFFSITPRLNFGSFETFVPVSFNEFAGTTSGLGLRLGGFFIGSNSILTAIINDSKQADFFVGFSLGFL